MPKGKYQYKFVVDNKWRFSKLHPTCNDGKGNINNIIDTTNFSISNENKIDTNIKHKANGKIKHSGSKNVNVSYPSLVPLKKDLHLDATSCPDNYKHHFGFSPCLYSQQTRLGRKEFLETSDSGYSNENTSLHSIPVPSHVNLNHLTIQKGSDPIANSVLVTCSTQRVRNKFLTLIYYKPVN